MQRFFGYTELQAVANVARTIVANASVTVYYAGTLTVAPIFSDNLSPPTAAANPLTSDLNGFFAFYAADGRYDVRFSGGTPAIPTPYTWGDVTLQGAAPLNVRDFGAVGNGSTDDLAAFNAAIAALPATGGVIEIPSGTFVLSGPWAMTHNDVIIRGAGRGATILQVANTVGITGADVGGGYAAQNVQLLNFRLYNTNGANTNRGINITGYARRWKIEGCHIDGFGGHGIYMAGGFHNEIRWNVIQQLAAQAGIGVYVQTHGGLGTATTLFVEHNHFVQGGTGYMEQYEDVVEMLHLLNMHETGVTGVRFQTCSRVTCLVPHFEATVVGTKISFHDTVGGVLIGSANGATVTWAAVAAASRYLLEVSGSGDAHLRGVKSISATAQDAGRLRGQVTIANPDTSATVTFTPNEVDTSYFLLVAVSTITGAPPAAARNVYVSAKATTGFTLNLDATPGAGNTVTVDWLLIR